MYFLTCRENQRGRGLVPVHPGPGKSDPAGAGLDRWTIFIHGYNNSMQSAAAIWSETAEKLEDHQIDLSSVVLFFWPGDWSRSEVYSAMNYPRIVPIAEETAKLLTDYLRVTTKDRIFPLEISFVAHSLGSVIVLETARRLRKEKANIKIRDILLMAAAVPEGFCMPGEIYGQTFSTETIETVLFSPDDGILKKFFKIGQEIADRIPVERRDAVGRYGGPGTGVGRRWSANAHMYGYGHGQYWKNKDSILEIGHVIAPKKIGFVPGSEFGGRKNIMVGMHEDLLTTDVLDEAEYPRPDRVSRWRVHGHDP